MTKMSMDASYEFVIPISYGSTEVIETGKWGFQKPHTAFMTAPCQEACPAGVNIPEFIYLSSEGKQEEALQTILKENPFPAVCGRVCFHPCETSCNRTEYDESVSIHAMERYVSDAAANQVQDIRPLSNGNSKRVAVVGAGPAGLSCAYFLSLLGHQVTLFEAKDEPGGVMRWGIPEYRLPRPVLKREIQRILKLPIDIRTGVKLGENISLNELNSFDAIFLSPGAGVNASLSIPGERLEQVSRGGEFLERINSKNEMKLGKETLVIGGGNTAMDVARSALRLGSEVTIAYRRTRNEMPAIKDEVDEAEEEGIRLQFLIQPVKISLMKKKRLAVTFQRTKLGGSDQSQRRKAIPIKGDFITFEADHLITAVGEQLDLSWIPKELVKNHLVETAGFPKIFAGGDAIAQPRTIVTAIASGKKAAISMDFYFREENVDENLSKVRVGNKGSLSMEAYLHFRETGKWPEVKEVVSYQQINTLYFEPSKSVKVRKRNQQRTLKGFSEVNMGYSSREAKFSASRCFYCGTCNYCYNCYFFCPEGVVLFDPVQRTRTVDFIHCKGCGTCAKVCPRNVVRMKEVE
jgi:NADPH-dependent glutamate synthase beta subunit-like oxidoreductase